MTYNVNKITFSIITCLILAILIVNGCKKNDKEVLDYNYYKMVMLQDRKIDKMESNLNNVSRAILNETSLKRKSNSRYRIRNSYTSHLAGKYNELTTAAKAVKNEEQLKEFLIRIGMRGQSENYINSLRNFLTTTKRFYNDNPQFRELSKSQQIELVYLSMLKVRFNKKNVLKNVLNVPADPCWDAWSSAIEDARDDQDWEMAELAVGFVLCTLGTEGVGVVFCYDAYVGLSAISALHYAQSVDKANDRYNACSGDPM